MTGGDERAAIAACRIASRIRVGRTVLGPYANAAAGELTGGKIECPARETIVDVGEMRAIMGVPSFPPPPGRPIGAGETRLRIEISSLRDGKRLYRYPR